MSYARPKDGTEPTVRRQVFGLLVAAGVAAASGRAARGRGNGYARDDIRRERGDVMARMGQELRAWRERSGILQQDLAAEGCVSATVVRRIEKGDYESVPPSSLIAAVARHQGPSGEIQELIASCRVEDEPRIDGGPRFGDAERRPLQTNSNARRAEAATSTWKARAPCLSPTPAATSFGLRPRHGHGLRISPRRTALVQLSQSYRRSVMACIS